MSKQIKVKKGSVEELIKEQDNAQSRVRNIQDELYERGEVKHEFHSPVMNSVYTEITPSMASKVLTNYNCSHGVKATNRTLNKKKATAIANDMRSGNFHGEVSTIIFDNDGVLMDGQTRLQAVLNSKQPVSMHVIMGVPRDGMVKIDIGRKRTNADRFRLAGDLGECTNTQAQNYERMARFSCMSLISPTGERLQFPFTNHGTTHTDEAIIEEFKRLMEPILYISENLPKNPHLKRLPVLVAIAQWWVDTDSKGAIQCEEAASFYNDLMSGGRIHIGDPILTLREKLLDFDPKTSGQHQRLDYQQLYGWTIFCINKHVRCEPLQRLTKRTGATNINLL